jgi:putative tryptophan/tyrosine transport system substrate-binding protein
MQRREFITLVAGAAVAWPVKIIGFLGAGAATAWDPLIANFQQRLRELGWIDGQTVSIVYRWAEGKSGRFGDIATEFVILTVGSAVATVPAPWRFFERQRL